MDQRIMVGRDLKQLVNLESAGTWGVLEAKSYGERTVYQALLERHDHFRNLIWFGLLVLCRATRQCGSRIVHDVDSDGDVSDTHAVVDQLASFPCGVPFVDVRSTDLQFQRGGDAIANQKRVKGDGLSYCELMGMQVNEARRYDQVRYIDLLHSGERLIADRRDLPIFDPHVQNGIGARCRIHDASAMQDYIQQY
jgi:hypothetical protein